MWRHREQLRRLLPEPTPRGCTLRALRRARLGFALLALAAIVAQFVSGASWLTFPALWTLYTTIRGSITGWYPYPFIDPGVHSPGRVAVNCAAILAGMLVVIPLVVWVGNLRRRLGPRGAPARGPR